MGTEDKRKRKSSDPADETMTNKSDVSNVLTVNLPSEIVFQQLMNYFKPKFGRKYYFSTEKVSSSHIEGKWEIGPGPALLLYPSMVISGYFKIDVTSSDGKSQVKLNFSSPQRGNIVALSCFIVGLILYGIAPPVWPIWLMLFCFAFAFFFAGQYRTSDVLREMNQFLSNIRETVVEEEEVGATMGIGVTMGTTEPLEILNVELPPEDVFQQLLDYFGDKYIKHKVPFSHIEGRWAWWGTFKIEIVPSNGKSQVKLNFSALYIILFLFVLDFIFSVASLLRLSPGVGLGSLFITIEITASVIIILMIGRWMKRTEMRRIKALFANKEDDPVESQLSHG